VVSRLDLFRGYFERLDPAATRLRAVRDELYVDPPGRAVGEQLAYRLQLAPRSAHLIVGSVGAGKTTQLVRAAELLNATGDTRAVYVDVSRRHDLDKNLAGVLLVLAGLELARQLRNVSDPTVRATCEQFSRWAYGHAEFVPYNPGDEYDDSDDDREQGDYVHRPGVLAQPLPPLPSSIKERIAALKILTAAMPPEAQHFVILFDSLDRLDDVATFQTAAVEDIRALQQAEIGLAIVGPGRIPYGPNRAIIDIFDQLHTVPAVDVRDGDGSASRFLEQVLIRRTDEQVIGSQARATLIHACGGILRDLLELTRGAVEEAFVTGAETVSDAHIARAVDGFGRTLMFGLRPHELRTLQELRRHHVFVPTTDDEFELLVSRRIIEYPGISKRYSVHPTIEPLLAALGGKA
jgi:hypothetical protein